VGIKKKYHPRRALIIFTEGAVFVRRTHDARTQSPFFSANCGHEKKMTGRDRVQYH
jgi:hypothetical protein